jgi:hypothetical protein
MIIKGIDKYKDRYEELPYFVICNLGNVDFVLHSHNGSLFIAIVLSPVFALLILLLADLHYTQAPLIPFCLHCYYSKMILGSI